MYLSFMLGVMRKNLWIIILVLLVIVIGAMWGRYNTMVGLDESVNTAWSQVENQYQRRADLVPNLVASVQGIADQERAVFSAVVEWRAKALQTSVDVWDPSSLQNYQEIQAWLSQWLGRLLAVVENYPDIKSNTNFSELQAQLEWTENRIAVERMAYNAVVQEYNVYIRRFPSSLFARLFGFDKATLFEAQAWSDQAPVVEFN
jgi:LemA protein